MPVLRFLKPEKIQVKVKGETSTKLTSILATSQALLRLGVNRNCARESGMLLKFSTSR
jgi:hypothetical protein